MFIRKGCIQAIVPHLGQSDIVFARKLGLYPQNGHCLRQEGGIQVQSLGKNGHCLLQEVQYPGFCSISLSDRTGSVRTVLF